MTRRFRPGLRARIIAWTFLPTMVILGAVAAFTFYTYGRVTETLVMERNRNLTELLAQQMSVELTGYVDTLNALAMTTDLQSMEPAYVQSALGWSVGALRDFDGGVVVLDAAGRVMAADARQRDLVGEDWSGRRFYQRLLTDATVPFLSDVEALSPDGRPAVAVVLPVWEAPRQPRGVLVGLFELQTPLRRPSPLYRSMARFYTHPAEGRYYLVDSAGRLIDPARTLAAGQDASAWPAVAAALGASSEAGASGDTVQPASSALRTTGLTGEAVIASYAPVPDTPWVLIEEQSWADLTAVSRGYGRLLLGLLLLGLAVPPVLVTLGLRRVVRPVAEMTAAAQRIAAADTQAIAAGSLEQRIYARTGDELEDLAGAFNAMSQRLQALYGSLERQVAERTHELATLNAVAGVVNRSLDLDETLAAALDETLVALDASGGAIAYTPRGTSSPRAAICRHLDAAQQAAVERALAEAPQAGAVLDMPAGALGAPLMAQGETVGALWLWPPAGGAFGDGAPSLLTGIGQGVGVAAENARLYAEAEQVAVAAERNRLARELHDSVTQTLFTANLIAGVLPLVWENDAGLGRARLAELHELTRGALAEMRMLLLELRPTALNAAPLPDLLAQLRDATAARARLPVELQIEGSATLPAEVRVALYRVAQEALNNAVKHAEAQALSVTLALSEGRASLAVRDDGIGFDSAQAPADHLGLRIMQERMAALGGTLCVRSRPGAGTEVIAEWEAAKVAAPHPRQEDEP